MGTQLEEKDNKIAIKNNIQNYLIHNISLDILLMSPRHYDMC